MIKGNVSREPQPLWQKGLARDMVEAHLQQCVADEAVQALTATDKDMADVGESLCVKHESLLALLVTKGVISEAEAAELCLGENAKALINRRCELRGEPRQFSLGGPRQER
ncbi:MAG: hypothetical protein OEX12_10835 [Gammaproteobacteria bacterium]|nr:hypothetical protein [Gammaproteobacteria bacterium]